MAAKETFGNGKGGKTYEDRQLANEVRRLTLAQSLKVLKKGKGKLYEALLIKLAGAALPRLNEITGENGGAIKFVEMPKEILTKHALDS
jgi:hypothetical protein